MNGLCRFLHWGACIVLGACHADARHVPTDWPLQFNVPSSLSGPLDPRLPNNAKIGEVRVCAAPDKQVVIVWTREARHELLSVAPTPPLDVNQVPAQSHTEDHEYSAPPGEYVGMCVLAPSGAGQLHFLPEIGADSGMRGWLLGELTKAQEGWLLALCAPHINVVRLDAAGFHENVAAIPQAHPMLNRPLLWAMPEHRDIRVFWLETQFPWWALPDSGHEHRRLHYALKTPVALGSSRIVHEFPFRFGGGTGNVNVVTRSPGRYDIIYEASSVWLRQGMSTDLFYASDVLSNRWLGAKRIATMENAANVAIVPWGDYALHVIWMDQETKETPTADLPYIRHIGRLHEVHLVRDRWSTPRRLFQHDSWEIESLAAASFSCHGREGVAAVWRGECGRLCYTLSVDGESWSAPTSTDLRIGSANWLVKVDDELVLVTRLKRNLYWCTLKLQEQEAAK